jgi:P2-related tail formation protein
MWEYFRDTLTWNLIRLKRGALAMLAEGGAASLDDARAAILWLRDQLHPELADAAYLTNYAASRGVRRHPSESDAQHKRRVVRAWYWHYLGGKQLGLPQVLALYGYEGATIRNWREVDPALWAEFWCNLLPPTTLELLPDDVALIVWTLNEYKPARSKLRGLTVDREITGTTHAAAVSWSGAIVEVRPPIATEVAARGGPRAGAGYWSVVVCAVYPPPHLCPAAWSDMDSAWSDMDTAWSDQAYGRQPIANEVS